PTWARSSTPWTPARRANGESSGDGARTRPAHRTDVAAAGGPRRALHGAGADHHLHRSDGRAPGPRTGRGGPPGRRRLHRLAPPIAPTSPPRVVLAAPATGQGKTTISTGLMAALRARGLEVSGHKVGPDYIDPGYHALATGRPGRNLDPHLVGEERIIPLLLHGARGADVAVVEGVMGLHDGRIGTDGFASTAHVAKLTRTPVVLVVDIARMSRSVGAVVAGMAAYDAEVDV